MRNPSPAISGTTQLYGVVADPIAQVQSPEVFNPFFVETRLNAVCLPFHVKKVELADFLNGLRACQNFKGLFISVPHKHEAASLCRDCDSAARATGAVNVIKPDQRGGWQGAMYDGVGFAAALQSYGCVLEGARVLLLGAGGVAAAIAHALLQHRVAHISICNRTQERGEALITRMRNYGQADQSMDALTMGHAFSKKPTLIINATTLGMAEQDPLPVEKHSLKANMFVAEVVARPRTTRLLDVAKEQGCSTMPGHAMFDHQLRYLKSFLGIPG